MRLPKTQEKTHMNEWEGKLPRKSTKGTDQRNAVVHGLKKSEYVQGYFVRIIANDVDGHLIAVAWCALNMSVWSMVCNYDFPSSESSFGLGWKLSYIFVSSTPLLYACL